MVKFFDALKAMFDSLVRTVVPYIVGFVITMLVNLGLPLDSEFEANLTAVLTIGFGTLYYVAARWLESEVAPKFGWLLGLPKTPIYVKTEEPIAKTDVIVIQSVPEGSATPEDQPRA